MIEEWMCTGGGWNIGDKTNFSPKDLINWSYRAQSPWLKLKCVQLAVYMVSAEFISKHLKRGFVHYLVLFHLPWNGNCKHFDSWIRMQFSFNCCKPFLSATEVMLCKFLLQRSANHNSCPHSSLLQQQCTCGERIKRGYLSISMTNKQNLWWSCPSFSELHCLICFMIFFFLTYKAFSSGKE